MVKLPPFLEADNPLARNGMRDNALRMMKGDPNGYRLNSLLVRNEPVIALASVLDAVGYSIERLKIYSGYVGMRGDISEVLDVAREHDVVPYIGGGVFDGRTKKGEVNAVATHLEKLSIDTVEVSNDKGDMNLKAFRGLVIEMKKRFKTVMVEVGRKTDDPAKLEESIAEIEMALDLGVQDIVLEGGGNGNYGIYNEDHNVRSLLLGLLERKVRSYGKSPIVEAATDNQHSYLVSCSGLPWNTRIGNVTPSISQLFDISDFRMRSMSKEGDAENIKRRRRFSEVIDYAVRTCVERHYKLTDLVNDERMTNICMCHDDHVTGAMNAIDEAIREGGRGGRKRRMPGDGISSLSELFGRLGFEIED